MCMSPLSLKHPSKTVNPMSKSAIRLEVPCNKCPECLENRRTSWSIRIAEEAKDHIHSSFITLTYDDRNIIYGSLFPTLVKGSPGLHETSSLSCT